MKPKSTTPRAALYATRRLKNAKRAITRARLQLEGLERVLDSARIHYAITRPLTVTERDRLAARVANGGALCCKAGLEWLRERLPEPWAQALNGWAYSALLCKGTDLGSEYYVSKVRRLELDRFPNLD